jgi:hypothetical protein
MTVKQILFSALILGFVSNGSAMDNNNQHKTCPTGEQIFATQPLSQQPKIFDKALDTKINGNPILLYFHTGSQLKGSPEFLKTMIVEFTENREFKEQGSLQEAKKNWHSSPSTGKFMKYAKANDAIFCPAVTQLPNRDGQLKDIGAIIYGTQNTQNCDRFAQHLKNRSVDRLVEEMTLLPQ